MNKEYNEIADAINKLKNADDVHDFAGNIAERINFIGCMFGFGEDAEESIKNEKKLSEMLALRCKEIRHD